MTLPKKQPFAVGGPIKYRLRLAVADDLSAIENIVCEAYTHYVPLIGQKPGPMFDDYASLIRNKRMHVFERCGFNGRAPEARGLIQGILVLIPQDDAMLLDNVAVAPAAQGTGVGRALLEFAERAAFEADFKRIRLYTNEMMTENIELYRRIGYVETHRSVENGLRRVYMEKALAGV